MRKNDSLKTPIIATLFLVLLIIFTFTSGNPPQCPERYPQGYTQAQIDAIKDDCIIGADIGGGLLILILVPAASIVLVLWAAFFVRRYRKN